MKTATVAAFLLLALLASPARGLTPEEVLSDPALETRARAITGELRCLVCQNQSIDDSDAVLAKDLRVLVREKLREGLSDAAVIDYVHARYGDFVLLRPPLRFGTILLWAAPALALLAGGWAALADARRNRRFAPAATSLTAEEQARLDALTRRED